MADPTAPPLPQPPDPADLQSAISEQDAALADIDKQKNAALDPIRESAKADIDKIDKTLAEPAKTMPLPENMAKHLDPKQLNDTASIFMTLGALGGLLMRQPLTAALNNMTAAMKGVQEGDAEQFDRATAEFKTNFDKAMKVNDAAEKERTRILNDTKLSLTEKMNLLDLEAVKYGDMTTRATGTFKGKMEIYKAKEKAATEARTAYQHWETQQNELQRHRETLAQAERHFQALHGNPMGAQGGQAPDQEALIEGIAAGRINPNVISIRGNQRAQIMEEVARRYPDYDMKNFVSKQAAEIAFTRGREAQAVRSFGVSDSHLKTLSELGDALQNGDIKLFNRVGNEVARQTGQQAPTNFDAAKRIVADEIVKAVTGAAGALGDRETADKTLSEANSPAQLKGVISTYRKLIGGQIEGLERQYKAGTGKDDFKQRFQIDGAGASTPAGGHPDDIQNLLKKYGGH